MFPTRRSSTASSVVAVRLDRLSVAMPLTCRHPTTEPSEGEEYVGLETLHTIDGNLDTPFDLVFPIPAVILRSQLRVV